MSDIAGISIKCEDGGTANAFELSGEKALDVHRVELVIERGSMRGRIVRGPKLGRETTVTSIDIKALDLTLMGTTTELRAISEPACKWKPANPSELLP